MQQIHKGLISFVFCMTFIVSMSAQQTFTVPLRNIPEAKGLYCDARIGGMFVDKCLLDTGASCVVLTKDDYMYFKTQGIIGPHNYVGESFTKLADNKRSVNKRYKLKSIQIGNVVIPNVIVTFATSPDGIKMRIIGLEILQRFSSVSINMKEKKMYLTL